MISRSLVILLAFIAAGFRASQSAWIEVIGLVALGGGLLVLQLSVTRPRLKRFAWICFAVTAVSVIVVFLRRDA